MNVKGIIADEIFRWLLKRHPWPWWIGLAVRKNMNIPIKRKQAAALRLFHWAMSNGQV